MSSKKENDSYVWISYSDLMTSVTFAFIFLFLCFIALYKHQTDALNNERQNPYQQSLKGLIEANKSVNATLNNLKEEIEKKRECDEVDFQVDSSKSSIRAVFKKNSGWFKEGEFVLNQQAKNCLDVFSVMWLGKLYKDKAIKQNIQNLVIEGHANSAGTYLYNLKLSQSRAFTASEYIFLNMNAEKYQISDWNDFKDWIEHTLTATGRSFSDPVIENRIENSEKSKRIEFKCLIKQDFEAMENVLRKTGK
jgi:chemotaxis protein MotB